MRCCRSSQHRLRADGEAVGRDGALDSEPTCTSLLTRTPWTPCCTAGGYQVLRPCRGQITYMRRVLRRCAKEGTCQRSGVSKNLNEADALHLSLRTSKLLNASVNLLLQNDFCLLQKREVWSIGVTGAPNMPSRTTELQRLLKYQEDSSTQLVNAENKTQ